MIRQSSAVLLLALAFVAIMCVARAETVQHTIATESNSEAFNSNQAQGGLNQLTRLVSSLLARLEQQHQAAGKGSLTMAVAAKSLRSTQSRLRKRNSRVVTLKLARKNLSRSAVEDKTSRLLRKIKRTARAFSQASRADEQKTKELLAKYQKTLKRFEKMAALRAKQSSADGVIALEVSASSTVSVIEQELAAAPARAIQNVFDLEKQREQESRLQRKSHVGFKRAVAILRLIVGALKAQSSSYAAQRAAAGTLIRNRLSGLKSCASQAIASVKQAEDAQRLQQQTARDLELADAREQAKEETERVKLVKQAFEKLKREAQRVSKRRQRLIRVLRSILNMLKGDNTASKGSFSKAIKKALEASAFSPYTVGRWSTCSAGCGVGTQTRSVECAGSSCVQPAPASSRPCFTRACPSSCRVGPWLAWTECSKSCGRGVQVRRREVISLGASAKCPTLTQSRTCEDQPCSA